MPPVVTRTIYNIGLRYTADTIVEERQQLSENKRCFFGLLSHKRGVQVTSVILWAILGGGIFYITRSKTKRELGDLNSRYLLTRPQYNSLLHKTIIYYFVSLNTVMISAYKAYLILINATQIKKMLADYTQREQQ